MRRVPARDRQKTRDPKFLAQKGTTSATGNNGWLAKFVKPKRRARRRVEMFTAYQPTTYESSECRATRP
jgi:hypothetical protein